jgi:hypothetical protein
MPIIRLREWEVGAGKDGNLARPKGVRGRLTFILYYVEELRDPCLRKKDPWEIGS